MSERPPVPPEYAAKVDHELGYNALTQQSVPRPRQRTTRGWSRRALVHFSAIDRLFLSRLILGSADPGTAPAGHRCARVPEGIRSGLNRRQPNRLFTHRELQTAMVHKSIRCDLITWDEVCRLAKRVAREIRRSGFRPDIVVAIARGGYVPARLLCDLLDLYQLDSVGIRHYQAGAHRTPEAWLWSPLSAAVQGLDVLLVDDVSDTGDSLRLALEHVLGLGPRSVKVAVLHHKEVSSVVPDFYGKRVLSWRWLIYPWAVMEDLSGFLAAMEPAPPTAERLVERLQIDHGIKVSKRLAADVLAARREEQIAKTDQASP